MNARTLDAHCIYTPNPVSCEGQQHITAALEKGEKLGAYLRRVIPNWTGDAWEVRIDGVQVPYEILDRVRPKGDHLIEVRGVAQKQALYIVAMAALTYWTMGAASALGTAGGTVFGLSGAAGMMSVVGVYAAGAAIGGKVIR